MPFIITDPCIGTKDSACVDVCPVDCIHPKKDEPELEQMARLVNHPEGCNDGGACVLACPVTPIYGGTDSTATAQKGVMPANLVYRNGDADAMAQAEAIVQQHI